MIENLQKKMLNISEVSELIGLKKSTIYKMTYIGEIPYYKPYGKNLYFDRDEIERWLKRNRHSSVYDDELRQADACKTKKKGESAGSYHDKLDNKNDK